MQELCRRERELFAVFLSATRFLPLFLPGEAEPRSLLERDESRSRRLGGIQRKRAQSGEMPADALLRRVGLRRPARGRFRLRSLLLHGVSN